MLNLRRAAFGLSLVPLLYLVAPQIALAQGGGLTVLPGGCGTGNLRAGQTTFGTQDTTGKTCTNAASGGGGGTSTSAWVSVPTDQLGVTTASAVGLNPPATSTMCTVTATVAGVNWRADGTNPTTGSSGGQPLGLGQTVQFFGATLNGAVKMINQTGASGALLNISCFKPG